MLLIVLAFLGFISLGLPDGLLGIAWPSMTVTFGLPLDALGILLAVTTAGYLISSASSGRVLKIMSIGTLLALSTAATALALLGYGLTSVWGLVVGLSFLAGAGAGAIDAGLNTFVATNFSARTLNWLHACFGVGTTLGPLIMTGVLSANLLWRWGYLLVGAAQLLLALTFTLTRRRWQLSPAAQATSVRPAKARETLRLRATWLGIAVFFVYAGVEVTAGQWTFSLLTLSRGVSESTAGLLVSLYWGGLMLGRVLFGVIVDRVPITPMLRFCIFVALAGVLLFWLDLSLIVTAAGLMLVGFSLAPIFPSLIATTSARLGAAHAGSAIGFQVAAAGFGVAVLPGVVGILAGSFGLELVGAAVFVLTLVLLFLFEVMTAQPVARVSNETEVVNNNYTNGRLE